MIFDGYTTLNDDAYMILINKDKILLLNLLNIEYVQEFDENKKILRTKDGEGFFICEEDTKIEHTKLPEGFQWNKKIYKTKLWYNPDSDPEKGWSGEKNFYEFKLSINKKR